MHVFLSALEGAQELKSEGGKEIARIMVSRGMRLRYNLMSYYALHKREKKLQLARFIRDNSEEIMIDSGAHSFQKGKKVDWDEYTECYADFIRTFDRPNVVGYFEMDVDKIIGIEKVKQLRAILEKVTDKIIPVWHKGRGIDEFKQMCQSHRGRVVAISGFANEDIRDEDFMMFVKCARSAGCRIHGLGVTRRKVLDRVPFDYVDSSSWLQRVIHGGLFNEDGRRVSKDYTKKHKREVFIALYKEYMKLQDHYDWKWAREHELAGGMK